MQRLAALILVLTCPLVACSADDAAPSPAAAAQTPPAQTAQPPATATGDTATGDTVASDERPTPAEAPTTTRAAQASAPRAAPPGQFEEGKDYRLLTPAQPTSSSPDQVEVAEVFMYSCIHCFNFESFVDEWQANKPANVNFIRVPASFNKMARFHTQVFYTVETMGLQDQLHEAIFTEYHVNKNRLDNESKLSAFLKTQDVDAEKFLSTMKSFAVDTKVRKADTLTRRYGISSVPTIVVNGKYVTQASMTRSFDRLRDVMNDLVMRESMQVE